MATQRRQHTKSQQYAILIEFLEKHTSFATGKKVTADGRKESNDLWIEITTNLNAAGPPTNDIKGWRKVWNDWKYKIRAKVTQNKLIRTGTGDGPNNTYYFNELEERAIDLLEIEKCVSGVQEGSFGAPRELQLSNVINSENNPENISGSTDDVSPSSPSTIPGSTRSVSQAIQPRKKNDSKKCLIMKQIKIQETFHQNIEKKLDKLYQINKENLKYKKKILELEEVKFKYQKERDKKLDEYFLANLRLTEAKLELKRQGIEIEKEKNGW